MDPLLTQCKPLAVSGGLAAAPYTVLSRLTDAMR